MPGTTAHGFRYPLDSDPVADGAEATRNLANDVDDLIGAVASGSAVVVVNAATTGTVNVTFPAGRFGAAPRVVPSAVNTSVYLAFASNITNAGCTLTVRRFDGASSTANVTCHWIASDQS